MEYDLIEWHFQPLTGQEDKKLDLHSVISGESNELSYLVLLPSAPDGLYHFNVGHSIVRVFTYPEKFSKFCYG